MTISGREFNNLSKHRYIGNLKKLQVILNALILILRLLKTVLYFFQTDILVLGFLDEERTDTQYGIHLQDEVINIYEIIKYVNFTKEILNIFLKMISLAIKTSTVDHSTFITYCNIFTYP